LNGGVVSILQILGMDEEHFDICQNTLKQVFVLLNYVQRGIPLFTDHGPLHTKGVLESIKMIDNQYPHPLSSEDKMLLALAAIFHDIGCIKERDNHNERSVDILKMPQFSYVKNSLNQESYRFLQQIIRAHSSDFDITTLKNDGARNSRLSILCCLFRLADECDVSSNRIPKLVLEVMQKFKVLPTKSLNIWKSHLEVEKVYFSETRIVVQVYDETKAKKWLDKLIRETKMINEVLLSYGKPIFTINPVVVPRP
jgi:hypothetical protein